METNLIRDKKEQIRVRKAVMLIISVVFAAIYYTSMNPIWADPGCDSACFALMGRAMLHGKVPYRDLVDNKGLILYWINMLAQIPLVWTGGGNSTLGIWLMEVLFLYISLKTIAWMADRLGVKNILIVQILYLFAMSCFTEGGNLTEEYTCCFTILSFSYALKYSLDEQRDIHNMRYGFVMGVLFALSFGMRPNNALESAAIIFIYAIVMICNKEWKNITHCIISAVAGVMIVFIPMISYLVINDALADCINQMFGASMGYFKDSGNNIGLLICSDFGHINLFILIMSVCFSSVAIKKYEQDKQLKTFVYATVFAACIGYCSSFISGFKFRHYILPCVVPMICSMLLALSSFEKNKIGKRAACIVLGLSAYIIWTISPNYTQSLFYRMINIPVTISSYINETNNSNQQYMEELLDKIPEKERNSVYIIDENLQAKYYVLLKILPCKRIFIVENRFCRVLPELRQEYNNYYTDNSPKWLILTQPLNECQWYYFYEAINRDYKEVYLEPYHQLHLLKRIK